MGSDKAKGERGKMNDTPRMTRVSMGQSFGPIVQAIIDEGMKLERELALANSACDSWRKLAMDRRDKIAKLEKENEWHPSSDRPTHSGKIMIASASGMLLTGTRLNLLESDKWRELPNPPKEGA